MSSSVDVEGMMECETCKTSLPAEKFSNRQRKRAQMMGDDDETDGLQVRCIDCIAKEEEEEKAVDNKKEDSNADDSQAVVTKKVTAGASEESSTAVRKCDACQQKLPIRDNFSRHQDNRFKKGKSARCKTCVEQDRPVVDDKEMNSNNNKDEDEDEDVNKPSTKQQEITDVAKPKRPARRTIHDEDDSDHDDEDMIVLGNDDEDEAGVSVEKLKHQILGRKVNTSPVDAINDSTTKQSTASTARNSAITIDENITNMEQLRSELSCAICHEVLYQPVSLHCGHSFCGSCLHWWLTHYSIQSSFAPPATIGKHGNCPTCRCVLLCEPDMLGVNTALRACVAAVFARDCQTRRHAEEQAERQATVGEDGGAHDRGYEVLIPVEEEEWRVVAAVAGENENNRKDVSARRSQVLDAEDQRMQLALALNGLDEDSSPAVSWKNGCLDVKLCLLTMEEDEVEDSGFPVVVRNPDDEHFIVKEERYCSPIEVTAEITSTTSVPVARRILGSNGVVEFHVDAKDSEDLKQARVLCFRHDETGAELQLRLPPRDEAGSQNPIAATTSSSKESKGRDNPRRFLRHDDSDEGGSEEEDGNYMDEFEEDGFVVGDDEEESVASDQVCHICQDGGDMIVCHGGDALEGCGRSFHVECIKRNVIPPGDWVCKNCAFEFGLGDVGIEGYEFTDGGKKSDQEEGLISAEADAESDDEFGQGRFSPAGSGAAFSDDDEDRKIDRGASKSKADSSKRKPVFSDSDDESPVKTSQKANKRQRFVDSGDEDD